MMLVFQDAVNETNRESKVPVPKKSHSSESVTVTRKLSSTRDKVCVSRSSDQERELSNGVQTSPKVTEPVTSPPSTSSPPVKESVSPTSHPVTSQNSLKSQVAAPVVPQFPPPMSQPPPSATVRQKSEDDLEHMQEVADNLVAKLMEDEERSTTHSDRWYYRDPQGEVQGKKRKVYLINL